MSQYSQKNTCTRPQACNCIKKETLAHGLSREFRDISKNTFFTEHLRATASIFGVKFYGMNFSLVNWNSWPSD